VYDFEVPAKLCSNGVIETQASINKKRLIGGEEAVSDEDKLRIVLHVGGDL